MKGKTVSVLLMVAAVVPSYGFSFFETFDSGASGWSSGAGSSTYSIVSDSSGKHLKAKIMCDDNTGGYKKPLGTSLQIGGSPGQKIYVEADLQILSGWSNYGVAYVGAGKAADNFKNSALILVYWGAGNQLFQISGTAQDSAGLVIRNNTFNEGMGGTAYRVKVEFGTIAKSQTDPSLCIYHTAKIYKINADGSTGGLVGTAETIQTDVAGELTVDTAGIFNCFNVNPNVFMDFNVDNIYVSDAGFNPNPARPSWCNVSQDMTDLDETFATAPTEWVSDLPAASNSSVTWKTQGGNGYLDVVLARHASSSTAPGKFYKPLGKAFLIDNYMNVNPAAFAYYFEYDAYLAEVEDYGEGLVGLGSTQYGGPFNDQNLLCGTFYGGQHAGDGIRNNLVSYGDNYPASRKSVTLAGKILPGTSVRTRIAVGRKGSYTAYHAYICKIAQDGSDGDKIALMANTLGASSENLYTDVMGFFTTLQSQTSLANMHLYVDNMHFSEVGFRLGGVKPAWMLKPLCSERTVPITGDAGSSAGAGVYDCVVNFSDLDIVAENWLAGK